MYIRRSNISVPAGLGRYSRSVVFDELTTSRIDANDGTKKVVSSEIPIIKEIASQENQPKEEEQQTPKKVHINPTSLAQSRAKRTIKPPSRYIETCYALLASEGDPSCFQEAIESNMDRCYVGENGITPQELHLGVSSETQRSKDH